ncbi:hypothetical protein [Pseudarthrobacter sp. BIM B-2242]|uniref:hypothetical protein n=1 Tax=Pseudarthrobacter sp. BIM B-2242 TaxID=2772401 RepID=UPI00168B7DB8|nr:hypothetical protein [Pseudarthrobacter sp. BIM B-2242]QOD05716.1 hypothetical protein IDT60_21985 [Pseudarthrobacter sp. BIM B-2242]
MAPLVIAMTALFGVFAWVAVMVALGAAKGKLNGEWVLWTFGTPRTVAIPVTDPAAEPGDFEGSTIQDSRQLKVTWKALGFTLAGFSAALAAVCALIAGGALTTYPNNYERSVWSALSSQYGVSPVITDQGFEPGISFPAMVDGKQVACSATPPSTVICDGELLQSQK